MSEYNQQGQIINNQVNAETINKVSAENVSINAGTVVLEQSIACYICEKFYPPGRIYRCSRCHKNVCINHEKKAKGSYCPLCVEIIKMDCEYLLFDDNYEKRIDAAQLLGDVRDLSMLPRLNECMEIEKNVHVRHWLAYAIGQTGGDDSYKMLKKFKGTEKDEFVLQGILDALIEASK